MTTPRDLSIQALRLYLRLGHNVPHPWPYGRRGRCLHCTMGRALARYKRRAVKEKGMTCYVCKKPAAHRCRCGMVVCDRDWAGERCNDCERDHRAALAPAPAAGDPAPEEPE